MVKPWRTLEKRIDVRFVSNKKVYLKWTSEQSHKSQRIFDNDLVAMYKNKVILKLSKPA